MLMNDPEVLMKAMSDNMMMDLKEYVDEADQE